MPDASALATNYDCGSRQTTRTKIFRYRSNSDTPASVLTLSTLSSPHRGFCFRSCHELDRLDTQRKPRLAPLAVKVQTATSHSFGSIRLMSPGSLVTTTCPVRCAQIT